MDEMNLFLFITNISVVALCAVLLPIIPAMTRKSYLFGVKVRPDVQKTADAKALRRNYTILSILGMIILGAICVAQYLLAPELTLIATMYFPLLIIPAHLIAYVPNWKKAVALKREHGWAVSGAVYAETKSSYSRGNLSEVPWIWYAVSLLIILVTIVLALVKYPSLPEQIPIHWDAQSMPDRWADKSIWALMMTPLCNLGMLLIMAATGAMIVLAKYQIDPDNAAKSFAQHRIFRSRMGHGMGAVTLSIALLFALIGFMSIFEGFSVSFWISLALPTPPIVWLVVVSVLSGQGGCRIKIPDSALLEGKGNASEHKNSAVYGRGDDKYWLIGMFYYNPDDPAYIVEQRFGPKLGFNYAHLPVKIGVAAGLLGLIAMYIWFTAFMLQML